MRCTSSKCRIYIVSHHGLFAEGIRSLLEGRRGIQIVGIETDPAKALDAIQSLRPEVIILEEAIPGGQTDRLKGFLQGAAAGRVVCLSLDHDLATVYHRRQVAAATPVDLVKAIQGLGKQHIPGPALLHPKAPMLRRLASGRDAEAGRSGRKLRARRTQKQGTKISDKPPRASRGSEKGG